MVNYAEWVKSKPIQDYLKDNNCYGCGALNSSGLLIKSYWDGEDQAVCFFKPENYFCAGHPSVVNGGLIATVVDCHCVSLATAKDYSIQYGKASLTDLSVSHVTASLKIDFIEPTPLDDNTSLVFLAKIRNVENRKTLIDCTVLANGNVTAKAEVLDIKII